MPSQVSSAPSRASFEAYVCVMRTVVTPPSSENSCFSTSEPRSCPVPSATVSVWTARSCGTTSVNTPRSNMAGSASAFFHTTSSAPPTRASHSSVRTVNPGGGIIQRRILSGVNIASHTRRGARRTRA